MSEASGRETPPGGSRASPGTEHSVPDKLPRHIAFIMDGNGRWARAQGLPRLRGHETGASALRRITRFCRSIGIAEVTFYALSTENFKKRPESEVAFLMRLLRSYLVSERKELLENGIRLRAVGRVDELPKRVLRALRETERLTSGETGMVLRLALNYGGRQEILDAVAKIARELAARAGREAGPIRLGDDEFRGHFYDPGMSDPDLLIRTGGELRLSNFLLWQCSYSEIWVTPSLWPDFDVPDLVEALWAYGGRERKYGAIEPCESESVLLESPAESVGGEAPQLGRLDAAPDREEEAPPGSTSPQERREEP